MKSVNKFCDGIKSTTPTENERGNAIYRAFLPSERYKIDFADDFTAEGWMQYDTDKDASYFGVWVNPRLLYTLTYAEGDWTLVVCPDAEHYNAEIRDANRFYGAGFICKAYGADGCTILEQDRNDFFLPTQLQET